MNLEWATRHFKAGVQALTNTPNNPLMTFFDPTQVAYNNLGENVGNESIIFHEALHGWTGLFDGDILTKLGMNNWTHPSCSISLRIQNSVLQYSGNLDMTDTWSCPNAQGDE
jgi:hypothetical protein